MKARKITVNVAQKNEDKLDQKIESNISVEKEINVDDVDEIDEVNTDEVNDDEYEEIVVTPEMRDKAQEDLLALITKKLSKTRGLIFVNEYEEPVSHMSYADCISAIEQVKKYGIKGMNKRSKKKVKELKKANADLNEGRIDNDEIEEVIKVASPNKE